MDKHDLEFMKEAIKWAKGCNPIKESIPKVGAVIALGQTVLGRGRRGTGEEGDDQHAEWHALAQVQDKSRLAKATLYTTLEPCTREVRSKPLECCTELIQQHGIKRLFVGTLDPNQGVTGKGLYLSCAARHSGQRGSCKALLVIGEWHERKRSGPCLATALATAFRRSEDRIPRSQPLGSTWLKPRVDLHKTNRLWSRWRACRRARGAGSVIFVLSGTHYPEMLKIRDPAQRRAIADVMEGLTDFATLVSRVVVMEVELSSMLDPVATLPSPLGEVPLIGRGVRHGAGFQSGLRIMGPNGDETERVRERVGRETFDQFIFETTLRLERSVLRGPADDEVAELRAYGWNSEAVIKIAENRAAEERAQTGRLDAETRWRRGRLDDLVSARELIIEFQNILPRALKREASP